MAAALVALVVLASRSSDDGGSEAIPGVQTFDRLRGEHVTTPVSYPQVPPVGGDHSPLVQPCGAFRQPVPNEQAVHSLEHGAVWVAYRPDLPPADVSRLTALANQTYVIVSPYPGLPAPVVASAWGAQLRLESASDPRLQQFVAAYRQNPKAPSRAPPAPRRPAADVGLPHPAHRRGLARQGPRRLLRG